MAVHIRGVPSDLDSAFKELQKSTRILLWRTLRSGAAAAITEKNWDQSGMPVPQFSVEQMISAERVAVVTDSLKNSESVECFMMLELGLDREKRKISKFRVAPFPGVNYRQTRYPLAILRVH